MDGQNRVTHRASALTLVFGFPQDPTLVDDLLCPAFNFGVAALHGIKIQLSGIRTCGHRAGRTAAHADAHARAPELNEQAACRKFNFVGLGGINHAQAASNHDGLVVAALNGVGGALYALLKFAEVAQQIGAAKLIVKSCATERAFGHDLQRAGNVRGLAKCNFAHTRPQFGHRKT